VKDEIYQLKPLLFTPEPVKYTNLFITENHLYLVGTMKHYDDCFIFKTAIENLQPDNKQNYDVNLHNPGFAQQQRLFRYDSRT
jgi:hypothetical protein